MWKALRRNPPEVRVTSGQKLCTKIICKQCIANFSATVLNVFSKEITFHNIKHQKQSLKFLRKTLESTGEMKLMIGLETHLDCLKNSKTPFDNSF